MNLKILHSILAFFVVLFYISDKPGLASYGYDLSQNKNLSVDKILSEVEKHYQVPGFEADFYQENNSEYPKATDKAKGKISVLKPDNLKWEYIKPFSQTIIYSKKKVLFFNPDDKQIIITSNHLLGKRDILFSYILGISNIKKTFFVSKEKELKPNNIYQLKLLPRTPLAEIIEANIYISKENFDLIKFSTISSLGNKITIEFKNINLAAIPNQNVFKIKNKSNYSILDLSNQAKPS